MLIEPPRPVSNQGKDRQSAADAPDGFDQAQTVAVGQSKVKNDRVIGDALDMSDRVVKTGGFVDAKAAIYKSRAQVAP